MKNLGIKVKISIKEFNANICFKSIFALFISWNIYTVLRSVTFESNTIIWPLFDGMGMACATSVVGSDIGGNSNIVERKNYGELPQNVRKKSKINLKFLQKYIELIIISASEKKLKV